MPVYRDFLLAAYEEARSSSAVHLLPLAELPGRPVLRPGGVRAE